MTKMAMLKTVTGLAVIAIIIDIATAATFTVGAPNGGWDASTNLAAWASSQSFSVGDTLVFAYTSNHDVVEVPKSDYDACQSTNSIQTYNSGNTVIPLSSPGKRYFICGTIGHCSQGMKVEIDTLATSSPPPAPVAARPPTAALPTPPLPSPPVTGALSPAPETAADSPVRSPTAANAPAISPSLSRSAQTHPLSAATQANSQFGAAVGFGFAIVMLLSL